MAISFLSVVDLSLSGRYVTLWISVTASVAGCGEERGIVGEFIGGGEAWREG
jgi:hypothetical protein